MESEVWINVLGQLPAKYYYMLKQVNFFLKDRLLNAVDVLDTQRKVCDQLGYFAAFYNDEVV